MLGWLIRLNGIVDLLMVSSHHYTKTSWWTPLEVPYSYVYFATFYGIVKLLSGASLLSEFVYAMEAVYFVFHKAYLTAVVCALIAAIISVFRAGRANDKDQIE